MAAARRTAEGDAYVRAGEWKTAFASSSSSGRDVHHATLGIIGMGRIGQAIARRARGFDMRILYNNRSRLSENDEAKLGATWVERDRLLAESDFVLVMAPYSPATHHLIGPAELAKMKPTAILAEHRPRRVVDDGGAGGSAQVRRNRRRGPRRLRRRAQASTRLPRASQRRLDAATRQRLAGTTLTMCRTAAANLTAVLEGRAPPQPRQCHSPRRRESQLLKEMQ
jgi:hypothetical protein